MVDRRTVARASIVALTIKCGRIMNLKKELQQSPVADLCRIKNDLDRLGMGLVITIGGILDHSARVADARRDHARLLPDQILHAPKASPGKDSAFRCHSTSST